MKILLINIFLFFTIYCIHAQTSIGDKINDPSAIMQLKSNNKGVLLPKVTLLNSTDKITIPNPANGLVVYHMGNQNIEKGLYVNIGTSSNPSWIKNGQSIVNDLQGSRTYKVKYKGRNIDNNGSSTKPTLKINELNIELRLVLVNQIARFQIRLLNSPGKNVSIKTIALWWGYSSSGRWDNYTFNANNFNVWQNLNGDWSETWSTIYYFTTTEKPNFTCNIYAVNNFKSTNTNNPAAIETEQYMLSAEVF